MAIETTTEWSAANLKPGACAVRSGEIVTLYQAGGDARTRLDRWIVVLESENVFMPQVMTAGGMAAFLNTNGFRRL